MLSHIYAFNLFIASGVKYLDNSSSFLEMMLGDHTVHIQRQLYLPSSALCVEGEIRITYSKLDFYTEKNLRLEGGDTSLNSL